MKHPRSAESVAALTVADLGEPGPGAELVDHLGPVLERLARGEVAEVAAAPPAAAADEGQSPDVVVPVDGTDEEAPLEALRADLLDLFEAQAASRWLDVAARRMAAAGLGSHTVASAGHEGNAAVAMALRSNDPALLHHRSTAFYLARLASAGLEEGIAAVARGLAGSSDQPAGGGRRPTPAHPEVAVLPPAGTVAGHLPRALGLAWAIGRQPRNRARLVGGRLNWPSDAVAVASFGDGTAGTGAALGAINAALWASRQGVPLPLLLVCEDNALGFSTSSPPGWIRSVFGSREGLRYFPADSAGDSAALFATARRAVETARAHRRPVLLHLSCVRIGGHSGADHELSYRKPGRISAELARDPLVATMNALVRHGAMAGDEVGRRLLHLRDQVASALEDATHRPRPQSSAEVMAPLSPRRPAVVGMAASREPAPERRQALFGTRLPEKEGPLTLAESINRTLLDAALAHPGVVVMGRDVARAGGLHGVTRDLHKKLGPAQVTDTTPDAQSILGLAMGGAVSGLLPIAELSLDDLHAAGELLRSEVATLAFSSDGAYRNPMVLRVPGLGYQDGFGGAVAVDNALGGLREIPGLVIACPAHPAQAPALLRTCLAAAEADGTVSVMLEPVALYHQRDLGAEGDDGWLAPYAPPAEWGSQHAAIGRAAVHGNGEDLAIAAYGNGLRMALRAAARLEHEGIGCRVVDLRWLAPLPVEDVMSAAMATGNLLIVDETRRTGGISESLVTAVLEEGYDGRLARVTAKDSPLPAGPAAAFVQLTEARVMSTARALCNE
ncbi:MFS transporter [Kineosporia sp. NBRC 101677]|uniref:transketolase C-terminal domain-containing protein n=1 Tax=Kineosporia sp. NBRC 101677 TaxID=3032197 RepID=UPI0024A0258D|nr:transketolase C-terminal domain-containing protein [Kineosporia sp. NBRC 101677]GLY19098.1 MFS transporter [Kineosporia sp. NBRC 101677]